MERTKNFVDRRGKISPNITPLQGILVVTLVQRSFRTPEPMLQDELVEIARIKNPRDLLVHFSNIRSSLSTIVEDPERYITTHDRFEGYRAAYSAKNLIVDRTSVPKLKINENDFMEVLAHMGEMKQHILLEALAESQLTFGKVKEIGQSFSTTLSDDQVITQVGKINDILRDSGSPYRLLKPKLRKFFVVKKVY